MMSLEFSMMKAVMDITRSVTLAFPPLAVGRKISARLRDKCEVDHRRLIRFDPGCEREGVSSSLFTPAAVSAGVFFPGYLMASARLRPSAKHV